MLDRHCRDFIARVAFVLIGSADAGGNIDLSPKGDLPGFVQVRDDTTLAIPERPGNRHPDTFRNVLENPMVGLIVLIRGSRESFRGATDAPIVRDNTSCPSGLRRQASTRYRPGRRMIGAFGTGGSRSRIPARRSPSA
jgi:uncharacterized protein